jgi:glutaryl-CoA dehydrogenase
MWITNGSIADVATVCARTADGIRGFLVPRGTPGFTTGDVHHKLSLRASTTSELVLEDVRLPHDAMLPEANGLSGPLGCLNEARFGIVWGATLRPEQVSLGKLNNVREAIEIARTCRTILGGSGITLEYPVLRHANNLESVLTYEGTSEVHQLAIGQALTGISAYR